MEEQFVLREKTLGQLLDACTEKYPDDEAVVFPNFGIRWTWRELSFQVDSLARGLIAMGIGKGEKVAIWATNVPHWITLMFATARIGAVLLTVNTLYRAKELHLLLKQSECENLFFIQGLRDHCFVDTVYELIPEMRRQRRGHLHSASLPHLKRLVCMEKQAHRGMYTLEEIVELGKTVSDELYASRKAQVSPYDVVNMQYTSGTTGFPKGVMLTHVNIGNNGYWIGARQHFSHKDRLCLPVPFFHCFGCVLGIMACVCHGVTMVVLETFSSVQVIMAVKQERCTGLYGVPTMYQAILDNRNFSSFDFSTLRTGVMGGSVCQESLMRQVMDVLHMPEITICYGLTEASPVMSQTAADDPLECKINTVGKPLPGIEIRIVNPDTGEECAEGENGEICCRGYNTMLGYYNMPQETSRAIDAQGWLHSGDLGCFTRDGYLRVTGRIKDMIIRGGENISPKEIEQFLLNMPGVSDVQVIAVPSRRYGEEVGAFFLSCNGAAITLSQVRSFCRGHIARYKIPQYVAVLDAYPLTASGKVRKNRLREMAAEMFPEAMEVRARAANVRRRKN
ncbi:MAG: AMP-binding protein [Desulfovibrionaceae bacterium]|nr:AMP-binding protein [Desulfovibrionaceae bacterium]